MTYARRAKYAEYVITLEIDELIKLLISIGEEHERAEDWQTKKVFGDYYDFVNAYGNFRFGKIAMERELNSQIDKLAKDAANARP